MNNILSANSLSSSVRVYRTLLVAYPKRFREQYEAQMVQVFRDSIREAYHNHGIGGLADLWIHILFDLVFTALNERIMERSQYMFSPKVILWGGVASAFGGLFWLMTVIAPSSAGATFVLALVLGLGGLAGLYSRQAGQGGRLGLAGLALGSIGTVLALTTQWSGLTSGPTIRNEPVVAAAAVLILSLAFVTLGIGLALLGVASLRAKTPHRWRGLPLGLGLLNTIQGLTIWLIAYVPLSQGRIPVDPWNLGNYGLLVVFVMFALLGLGWIGLGTMLASEGDAQIPVAQPPSASA